MIGLWQTAVNAVLREAFHCGRCLLHLWRWLTDLTTAARMPKRSAAEVMRATPSTCRLPVSSALVDGSAMSKVRPLLMRRRSVPVSTAAGFRTAGRARFLEIARPYCAGGRLSLVESNESSSRSYLHAHTA